MGRLTTTLALAGGAIAGLGAFNLWLGWQAGPLENRLPGKGRFYHWTPATARSRTFFTWCRRAPDRQSC